MQQLDMLEVLAREPVRSAARLRGEVAGEACVTKAQRVTQFDTEAARAFVLEYLAVHGASWGEDIVDAAIATGQPALISHDGRAWGPVFAWLSGKSLIRCLRADGIRRHGNGCSGARQWALVVTSIQERQ